MSGWFDGYVICCSQSQFLALTGSSPIASSFIQEFCNHICYLLDHIGLQSLLMEYFQQCFASLVAGDVFRHVCWEIQDDESCA